MRPDCRRRGTPPGEVRLAKAGRGVQPRARSQVTHTKEKPPGAPGGFFVPFERRLLRPRAAVWTHHRAALGPTHTVMHPAAMPAHAAFTAEFVSAHPGEHGETALLAFAQALVERAGRVGEFLERGAALRHRVGAKVQPLDRILGLVGAGMRGEPR